MKIKTPEGVADFNHLDSTPPEGAKPAASVMTVEATVDVKPQELRTLRPFVHMQLRVPGDLKKEAQIVLLELFNCFAKAGEVKEGLIGDILWGFEQARIPGQLTIVGLRELHAKGFLRFQAKDNEFVDFSSDKITGAFVRYQPKLLELVYEGAAA